MLHRIEIGPRRMKMFESRTLTTALLLAVSSLVVCIASNVAHADDEILAPETLGRVCAARAIFA